MGVEQKDAGYCEFSERGGGADVGPIEVEGLLGEGDCYFEEAALGNALLDVGLVLVVIDAHDFSLCRAAFEGSGEVELVAEKMRTSGWSIGEEYESRPKEGQRSCWQLISQNLHSTADEELYIFGIHCSSLSIN